MCGGSSGRAADCSPGWSLRNPGEWLRNPRLVEIGGITGTSPRVFTRGYNPPPFQG